MSLPHAIDVALPDGRMVTALVCPSQRARIARIRVGAQAPLHIVVPDTMAVEQAEVALGQKAGWIARKLDHIDRLHATADSLGMDRPGVVWLRGDPLELSASSAHGCEARQMGGALEVDLSDPIAAAAAVETWYRKGAGREIRRVVQDESGRLGIRVEAISVRDQRTRWGSCSAAGRLSFNWRLVMAPSPVLRYVVIHELLHVRIPNHSKAFWRALHAAMPGWETQAAWLREHGDELRGYRLRLEQHEAPPLSGEVAPSQA